MSDLLKTPDIPAFPSTTQKEVKKAFTIIKDWARDASDKINKRFLDTVSVLFAVNTPTNNQTLVYDNSSGYWRNKFIKHSWLEDRNQADDTSSSTEGDKHVSNALVKKYNDHILIIDGNPHGTDHSMLDAIQQADDTSTNTDGGKHVTNALVKKYNDHLLIINGNPHGTDHSMLDSIQQARKAHANDCIESSFTKQHQVCKLQQD